MRFNITTRKTTGTLMVISAEKKLDEKEVWIWKYSILFSVWNNRFQAEIAPGQPERRPLRSRLLQYSIDVRDNFARLRGENAP